MHDRVNPINFGSRFIQNPRYKPINKNRTHGEKTHKKKEKKREKKLVIKYAATLPNRGVKLEARKIEV